MTVYGDKGIRYSEYIVKAVNDYFLDEDSLTMHYETYYNCREQGYVMSIADSDYKKRLDIWVCAHRNSDEPTIVWSDGNELRGPENMFTEESYYDRRETFKYIEDATDKVIELIKNHFEIEF